MDKTQYEPDHGLDKPIDSRETGDATTGVVDCHINDEAKQT